MSQSSLTLTDVPIVEHNESRHARRFVGTAARSLKTVADVFVWEIRSFFLRPAVYLLYLCLTLLAGWSFSWLVTVLSRGGGLALRQGDDVLFQFLGPNVFIVGSWTCLVPLLTMNLIADERRRGTWETLLTTPLSPYEVVVGKFLAGWCSLLTALIPWGLFLCVLRFWNGRVQWLGGWFPWIDGPGLSFDFGPVLGAVLGLSLIGLTLTAIGLLGSSLCRGPFAAALVSFVAMLIVVTLSLLPKALTYWQLPAEQIQLAEILSCWGHLERFSQGLVDPRIIAGHLSVTVFVLWLTVCTARYPDNS